jgi:hypothetical protein
MALKGKPRDMNKWREVLLDPNVHFPGESSEYRRTRNELLEAEAELRRLNEQVAAQRRALPAGGLIREDYVFESAADGSKVETLLDARTVVAQREERTSRTAQIFGEQVLCRVGPGNFTPSLSQNRT